jgi:site-specific DNA-methyltransferase (adenine-specific)/site-specific DNA-methyltransferase (cytosine-N4-specific)
MATECSNKSHSAAFPEALPEWFIKLFSKEGDVILDPFMGSGTTLHVARKLNRRAIGIDIMPEYFEMVENQLIDKPARKQIKAKSSLQNQPLLGETWSALNGR